ncbi:MAG: hypothetical protein ABIE68_04770 [bacterium]
MSEDTKKMETEILSAQVRTKKRLKLMLWTVGVIGFASVAAMIAVNTLPQIDPHNVSEDSITVSNVSGKKTIDGNEEYYDIIRSDGNHTMFIPDSKDATVLDNMVEDVRKELDSFGEYYDLIPAEGHVIFIPESADAELAVSAIKDNITTTGTGGCDQIIPADGHTMAFVTVDTSGGGSTDGTGGCDQVIPAGGHTLVFVTVDTSGGSTDSNSDGLVREIFDSIQTNGGADGTLNKKSSNRFADIEYLDENYTKVNYSLNTNKFSTSGSAEIVSSYNAIKLSGGNQGMAVSEVFDTNETSDNTNGLYKIAFNTKKVLPFINEVEFMIRYSDEEFDQTDTDLEWESTNVAAANALTIIEVPLTVTKSRYVQIGFDLQKRYLTPYVTKPIMQYLERTCEENNDCKKD